MLSPRLWTACLVLIAAVAASPAQKPLAKTQLMMASTVPNVKVPDFTRMTWAQVQSAARIPGTQRLMFSVITPEPSQDGVVVSQSIKPGTMVYPGEMPLTLTLAPAKQAGPSVLQTFLQGLAGAVQRTTVPNVIGKNRNEVVAALRSARLRPQFTGDLGGEAVVQDPEPDSSVQVGSVVAVTLQMPQVTVPSVVGLTGFEAGRVLAASSLRVAGTTDSSDDLKVEAQSVPPGTQVQRYTVVNLTMAQSAAPPPVNPAAAADAPMQPPDEQPAAPEPAKPPDRVRVPNLIGMDLAAAELRLQKSGLRSGEVSGDSNGGVVNMQLPRAGAVVPRTELVSLTFAAAAIERLPPPPTWWERNSTLVSRTALLAMLGALGLAGVKVGRRGAHRKSNRAGVAVAPAFRTSIQQVQTTVGENTYVVKMTIQFRSRDMAEAVDTRQEPAVRRRQV